MYLVTINLQLILEVFIMKSFTKNIVTRRLCSLVLALIISAGVFGNIPVLAAESNDTVSPYAVTVLLNASTGDYVTGNKDLGGITTPKKSSPGAIDYIRLTISYSFEDTAHAHDANLVFINGSERYGVSLKDTLSGTTDITLKRNTHYTVRIEPGCSARYMASVNVYY